MVGLEKGNMDLDFGSFEGIVSPCFGISFETRAWLLYS